MHSVELLQLRFMLGTKVLHNRCGMPARLISLRCICSIWMFALDYVCTALPAMQLLVIGFVAGIFVRANDPYLENDVPGTQ